MYCQGDSGSNISISMIIPFITFPTDGNNIGKKRVCRSAHAPNNIPIGTEQKSAIKLMAENA